MQVQPTTEQMVNRDGSLTHVCSLIAALHDGPVNARNQPRAQNATDEQPGEASTQAEQNIVEEEEVVEVVEGFPVGRSPGSPSEG